MAEDLPVAERSLRAEEDRALDVFQLYQKYLDPADLASYLPSTLLWKYESQDQWWTRASSPTTRALMTAELKSIRAHAILPDGEILDLLGDETLERDLPVAVRTQLRAAARKAGREGRPFRDGDLFSAMRSEDGKQDLTDHLVEHVAPVTLRKVVARAAEVLGLTEVVVAEQPAQADAAPEPAKAPPAFGRPQQDLADGQAGRRGRCGRRQGRRPQAPRHADWRHRGAAARAGGVHRPRELAVDDRRGWLSLSRVRRLDLGPSRGSGPPAMNSARQSRLRFYATSSGPSKGPTPDFQKKLRRETAF